MWIIYHKKKTLPRLVSSYWTCFMLSVYGGSEKIMKKISTLPVWKKGASAEDRFNELAMMAREHPERFNKIVVLYEEDRGEDGIISRQAFSDGMTTTIALGIIKAGEMDIYLRTRGLVD